MSVIPSKRDWRGEKYGFIRFFNIENTKFLETKLDNLWLEGRKLRANVSKFNRNNQSGSNKVEQGLSKSVVKADSYKQDVRVMNLTVKKVVNISFANMVKSGREWSKACEASDMHEVNKMFFFKYEEADKERFIKDMVGVAKSPGLAFGVNQSLLEEGIFTISATSQGPNLCLLEEKVKGYLENLLQDEGEWKETWFKEVRKGKHQMQNVQEQYGYQYVGSPVL